MGSCKGMIVKDTKRKPADPNFTIRIAGTHTTSATTALLFYHLLHGPEIMDRCVAEIDTSLPSLESGQSAHSIATLEASLPYLRQCIRENFRITPVFTMPLARRVTTPEGITIADRHIKQGVGSLTFESVISCLLFWTRHQSRCVTTPSTTIPMFGALITISSTLQGGRGPRRQREPNT